MVPKMCKNTHFSHFYLHMSEKIRNFAAESCKGNKNNN